MLWSEVAEHFSCKESSLGDPDVGVGSRDRRMKYSVHTSTDHSTANSMEVRTNAYNDFGNTFQDF
jgi:hypothetical protein